MNDADSTSGASPWHGARDEKPLIFQNGHNKARFPGRLGKNIIGEKEVKKVG
jgi:hypothetical protein